jgi:hypothetical protein
MTFLMINIIYKNSGVMQRRYKRRLEVRLSVVEMQENREVVRGGEIVDRRESVNSSQGDHGWQQEYRAEKCFYLYCFTAHSVV